MRFLVTLYIVPATSICFKIVKHNSFWYMKSLGNVRDNLDWIYLCRRFLRVSGYMLYMRANICVIFTSEVGNELLLNHYCSTARFWMFEKFIYFYPMLILLPCVCLLLFR